MASFSLMAPRLGEPDHAAALITCTVLSQQMAGK
jgi:hypothetical protein